jgi:glycosyltransferase involved in cell wall biosynthesis
MKIALVHDWLTGMRGGEKCLEAFCERFPDATLHTLLHRQGKLSPAIERMDIRTSFLQKLPGASKHYRHLLPLMPRAIESLELPADVDLVLSFSHAVAKSVHVPPGVPHVCYCFTPMRYAWHLRDQYIADDASAWPRPWDWARNHLLDRIREWDRATADRVTHFVAISETIAMRIRECYDRESSVIYPPVDTEFFCPADVQREDFYLCFSALVPYKRVELAIEACQQLDRRLVVIGAGPERQKLEKLAGPNVQFAGWQSDESIRDHLRRCRALLFAAHEDFGIAPVEAQACGTPVIAYGAGGSTETLLAADETEVGTATFFAEQTADAMADAICWYEGHPKQFSPQLARQNAERFERGRYEQDLLAVLERAAAESTPPLRRAA